MTANEARQKAIAAIVKDKKESFDEKEFNEILGKISEAAEAKKLELEVRLLSVPVQTKLMGMGYAVLQARTPGFPITIKW